MKDFFRIATFATDMIKYRQDNDITVRQAADEIGVHKNVYFKAEDMAFSEMPLRLFLAICDWMKQDPAKYIAKQPIK